MSIHVVEPTERSSGPSGWGQHPRIAAASEFRTTLSTLGIPQHRAARLFGVGARSIRRWAAGDRRIPPGAAIVIRLLIEGTIRFDRAEPAVPAPARTKGGTKPESLAPLLVKPAPKHPPWARTEAVAPANANLTVEKVLALAPGTCRWP